MNESLQAKRKRLKYNGGCSTDSNFIYLTCSFWDVVIIWRLKRCRTSTQTGDRKGDRLQSFRLGFVCE